MRMEYLYSQLSIPSTVVIYYSWELQYLAQQSHATANAAAAAAAEAVDRRRTQGRPRSKGVVYWRS